MVGLSARFYVSDFGIASFQHLVGELIGASFDRFNSTTVRGFAIDAYQNEDFDRQRPEKSPSVQIPDWLFYRWTLWIESEAADATLDALVDIGSRLAAGLRKAGADVVVASDFEDEINAAAAGYAKV